MSMYVIDSDNNVTILKPDAAVPEVEGPEKFNSLEELAQLASNWPASHLIEIWNSLPGVVPVRKFTNRSIGVTRIWKALQQLSPALAPHSPTVAPENTSAGGRPTAKRKGTFAPKRRAGPPKLETQAREGSKKAAVLALLRRAQGATLGELMKATGWQPHSVRGFLSGAVGKKMGLELKSTKNDAGERMYSL